MNKRKRKELWPLVVLSVLAVLVAVTPAFAQQPTADEINQVAKKLSCPTCTGINVADCPTETCAQWRAKIGEMLAENKSEQEILDYFAARYGDHVLQVPPKRGFFILVWVLPVIAILAGLAWLAFLMSGWSKRRSLELAQQAYPPNQQVTKVSTEVSEGVIPEDEYLKRVQQDLEKLS